jgi:hypothetical protein
MSDLHREDNTRARRPPRGDLSRSPAFPLLRSGDPSAVQYSSPGMRGSNHLTESRAVSDSVVLVVNVQFWASNNPPPDLDAGSCEWGRHRIGARVCSVSLRVHKEQPDSPKEWKVDREVWVLGSDFPYDTLYTKLLSHLGPTNGGHQNAFRHSGEYACRRLDY